MKRLIGPTALALVLVAVAAALGVWQLRAWQDRRDAEARDLTQLDPVPLADVMGPDDPFPGQDVGRPVDLAGEWLPQGAFYVSGREDAGRDGLWLVVPLAVGGPDDPAIPVVLGWTESQDASLVPSGEATVTGWLQPPEGNGAFDDDPDDDVVPQLRTADAIQRVDNDLYSAYAVATSPADGLDAATLDALPEVGRFTALRNLLYAFEWWFFGAFAAFVWWRWVRDEQAVREAEAASVD
ncbi:SURF1 family protein [Nocardioides currus]|uniref:SURF1 family protein n=1 Tax=Nocardioides currus TaxID=2133958 RepID=UPI001402CEA0|nr:SURF1 family protein [Nocardioides currus]